MSAGRERLYMERGGKSISVVDHIFDKLVHIRLPEQITNPELVALYRTKHEQMAEFVLKHAKEGYEHYEEDLLVQKDLYGKEWGC